MKEIGGYFQLDQFVNKQYYKDLIELNTGRNALIYLVKSKAIEKIYLPYFLCECVADILNKYSIKYEYYQIDRKLYPILDRQMKTNEYLYVVNYYGQLSDDSILKLKERYCNIIVDNTHSFFQKPILGIDTLYSCRKYFGVPDGAYLSTDTILKEELEYDKSIHRMSHILGRFEEKASDYYEEFHKNDKPFIELPLMKMSHLTNNILGAIDYEYVIKSRNRNFRYLHNKLNDTNGLNIKLPKVPFSYPYYIKNGIQIRKKLAELKIYIPTLWPNVLRDNNENTIEYDFAANILPLPCDQRYNEDDMEIIVKELKNLR